MDTNVYDAIYFSLRALFLVALPMVIVVSLAGIVVGAFQGATSIKDSASQYAVKLIALIGALYFLLPSFLDSLLSLARLAFSGF